MGTVKVILKKDIPTLGEEGDVKTVRSGYARNYLIPNGLAVSYTLQNRNILERKKELFEKKKLEKKENAKQLKEKLEKEKISVKVSAGEKGRLYGTVTTQLIMEELNKLGYNIDKRKIELKEHIKFAGNYKFYVHLYQDINATLDLEVLPIQEEKKEEQKQQKKKKRRFTQDRELQETDFY